MCCVVQGRAAGLQQLAQHLHQAAHPSAPGHSTQHSQALPEASLGSAAPASAGRPLPTAVAPPSLDTPSQGRLQQGQGQVVRLSARRRKWLVQRKSQMLGGVALHLPGLPVAPLPAARRSAAEKPPLPLAAAARRANPAPRPPPRQAPPGPQELLAPCLAQPPQGQGAFPGLQCAFCGARCHRACGAPTPVAPAGWHCSPACARSGAALGIACMAGCTTMPPSLEAAGPAARVWQLQALQPGLQPAPELPAGVQDLCKVRCCS
jgi:hypothetical protein